MDAVVLVAGDFGRCPRVTGNRSEQTLAVAEDRGIAGPEDVLRSLDRRRQIGPGRVARDQAVEAPPDARELLPDGGS